MDHTDIGKASRAADRALIVQLDTEIHELRERIHLLQKARELQQKRLDTYTYPVLTLPHEIVSKIFVYTLPPYPDCPPLTSSLSPTSLTHICRHWREMTLAMPYLWRAIPLGYFGDASHERQTRVLESWMDRAGGCPLSIEIKPSVVSTWLFGFNSEPILLRRERLEYLKLALANSHVSFLKGSMPLLRSLSLHLEYKNLPLPTGIVCEYPRLEAVSLTSFPGTVDWLPWPQLTSLTLRDMTADNSIPILQQTTNLVHLTLILTGGDAAEQDTETALDITLPSLEALAIGSEHSRGEVLTRLFSAFFVPGLDSLQVPERFFSAADLQRLPTELLRSFLRKSGCQPRKILLTGRMGQAEHWYREAFPEIEFSFHPSWKMDDEDVEIS
ncbi:hypothetical protein FB45DRAFT_1124812 [Roridomyces roridus]|uniref:F-box domain-containing protein n=1 Tax=Roridomyces roridus TaxID=1738132 RepID=A0AAD7C991_9AGAR|nr:hypothetical protein FB45DRAFT_1124812 [Roridomyces roridus]